jgi:hypothetical protein
MRLLQLIFFFSIAIYLLAHSACNKKCSNCNVRQLFSTSDSTLTGYPYEEEKDARYCDAQIENLIQSQGAFVYEYTKGNGDKYTITEVLIVKCDQ